MDGFIRVPRWAVYAQMTAAELRILLYLLDGVGGPISHRRIAEDLHLSKVRVREAIRSLAQKGYITVTSGKEHGIPNEYTIVGVDAGSSTRVDARASTPPISANGENPHGARISERVDAGVSRGVDAGSSTQVDTGASTLPLLPGGPSPGTRAATGFPAIPSEKNGETGYGSVLMYFKALKANYKLQTTNGNGKQVRNGNSDAHPVEVGGADMTTGTGRKRTQKSTGVEYTPGGFVVDSELLARWKEAYPAVDVLHEIKAAFEWVEANPTRRKSNWRRFLVNWLKRSQDRAQSRMRDTPGEARRPQEETQHTEDQISPERKREIEEVIRRIYGREPVGNL